MGQDPPGDIPVMFLPGIVSGRDRGHSPLVFSPDGREAYWTEMGMRAQGMMKMVLEGGRWSAPENTGLWGDPGLSPDGGRMAFINRVEHAEGEGEGVDHIYYMDRTEDGWTAPVSAGDEVNAKKPHWRPSLDSDGNLYFSEFADRMYFSPFSGGEYGEPVLLSEYLGNETIRGYAPFISPGGDYLLFSDGNRMYVSFRDSAGRWLDRIDMGEKINAPDTASDLPVVTPDGRYIFFLGHGSGREWGVYWVSAEVIGRLKADLGL
ncbi:MAG TPA: hypothetical protein VLA34_06620, partial [Candidatus Krumholzibacterium sp.]|nr:hypothetical protein [Candidatus Krumholzibacterium sp.]